MSIGKNLRSLGQLLESVNTAIEIIDRVDSLEQFEREHGKSMKKLQAEIEKLQDVYAAQKLRNEQLLADAQTEAENILNRAQSKAASLYENAKSDALSLTASARSESEQLASQNVRLAAECEELEEQSTDLGHKLATLQKEYAAAKDMIAKAEAVKLAMGG